MVEFEYLFRVFIIPLIALISPLIIVGWRVFNNKLDLSITRKILLKFTTVWILLSTAIFTGLLTLTGGVGFFFRLEKGIFIGDRDIVWNVTEHLRVVFVYDPGIGLIVISLLSGLLYSSLLTLPKVCTRLNQQDISNEMDLTAGKSASLTSSISSAASAFATTAVCCTTSAVAIILPSVSVLLGPFVPGLMIASFVLLNYSFTRIVLPRFVIPSFKFDNLVSTN